MNNDECEQRERERKLEKNGEANAAATIQNQQNVVTKKLQKKNTSTHKHKKTDENLTFATASFFKYIHSYGFALGAHREGCKFYAMP